MLKPQYLLLLATTLAACDQKPKEVRVTNESAVAKVQSTSRSEPIFYNGKTYQFDLTPNASGEFALKVSPMTAAQRKDAVQLATSSLGYYACVDGKAGKLMGEPSFTGKTWKMTAKCN
jgi:hypothetical protein